MAEIPDEEKLAIATHFLLSSPPAEVKEVLSDVKVVLNPPTLMTDGVLKGIFRKYNTQNFEVVDGEGTPVLLSEFGELDAKHYLTGRGEVFVVDHVAQKGTKATDGPTFTPGPMEATRDALQKVMEEYATTQFSDGSATVAVYEKGSELVVLVSGSKANLRNYWSGKWRSEWHVDPKGKTVKGKVRILIHYFEDGNVQLDQNKDIDKAGVTAKGSDEKSFAEGVKSFISAQEGAIQETLEEMYQNMSVETFKDMRRILPIAKTKMDWTGAQMKLAGTMGKGKQ
jgi:capping protein alpha